MAQARDEHVIYSAGLFDGEGCISASLTKRDSDLSKNPSLTIAVCLSMTHKKSVLSFQRRWGGSFRAMPKQKGYKQKWEWRLNSRAAVPFLIDVLPYFVVMQKQAELVIAYFKVVGPMQRGRPLSLKKIQLNAKLHQRLSVLNLRGA